MRTPFRILSVLSAVLALTNTASGRPFRAELLVCRPQSVYLITDLDAPVSRCTNCFPDSTYTDAVTHYSLASAATAIEWKLCEWTNGKVMFKNPDTDKFLARCHNGYPMATYPDSAFAYANKFEDAAQWRMETINTPQGDVFAFKEGNGKYLARCRNCVNTSLAPQNTLFVHETSSAVEHAQFRLVTLP